MEDVTIEQLENLATPCFWLKPRLHLYWIKKVGCFSVLGKHRLFLSITMFFYK
ncbi:UNVERIFIED_CONTAM: hypothetical protein ABID98_001582 [Brevibacillus sp. OAP136]